MNMNYISQIISFLFLFDFNCYLVSDLLGIRIIRNKRCTIILIKLINFIKLFKLIILSGKIVKINLQI